MSNCSNPFYIKNWQLIQPNSTSQWRSNPYKTETGVKAVLRIVTATNKWQNSFYGVEIPSLNVPHPSLPPSSLTSSDRGPFNRYAIVLFWFWQNIERWWKLEQKKIDRHGKDLLFHAKFPFSKNPQKQNKVLYWLFTSVSFLKYLNRG